MGATLSSCAMRAMNRLRVSGVSMCRVLGTRALFASGAADAAVQTTATRERWLEEELAWCECHRRENFFAKSLGRHVTYDGSADAFYARYPELTRALTSEARDAVHAELASELMRRETRFEDARRRKAHISANYAPLHRELFDSDFETRESEFVDARWTELARTAKEATAAAYAAARGGGKGGEVDARRRFLDATEPLGTIRESPRGVFTFPALTPTLCRLLREELDHFERSGMPRARPNTMNDDGVLLHELGLCENLLDPLLREYIAPMARALYHPRAVPGCDTLDHHRSFSVSYDATTAAGKDADLAYHFDDAEVTINVCVSPREAFDGGELLFGGVEGEAGSSHARRCPRFHREGVAVMHAGKHCHEAMPTTEGRRTNLIAWCRSSARRAETCGMCGRDKRTPYVVPGRREGD